MLINDIKTIETEKYLFFIRRKNFRILDCYLVQPKQAKNIACFFMLIKIII